MSDEIKQHAIVELFGHKTLAGCVTKDTSVFPMLRIDVPATSQYPAFTAEYGPGAIYGIRYVSEEVAQRTAEAIKENPVTVYAPDLVTRETFDRTIKEYQDRIREARALSSGDHESDLDDAKIEDHGIDEDEIDGVDTELIPF